MEQWNTEILQQLRNMAVVVPHRDTTAHRPTTFTTLKDDELGLLDNAYVKKSSQVLREYKPIITTFNSIINPEQVMAQHTVDVPCVEVQIPARDWKQIEEIVQAHERAIKNPAVQDAWDQYLMIRHLTDQNLPKR